MVAMSIDASGFEKRSKAFERAPAKLKEASIRNFKAGLYVLRSDAEQTLRDVTPVRTGKLAGSTRATIVMEGEMAARIETRQPATNEQGQMYAQWVIGGHHLIAWGHDTDIDIPPNPYPEKADATMRPAIQRALQRAGHDAMIDVTNVIEH